MTDRTSERQPTSRQHQSTIIAATIPFALLAPPFAGMMLAAMVMLRWDLRREPVWWGLVLAGWFLPWVYILVAIFFLFRGGTKPRERGQESM